MKRLKLRSLVSTKKVGSISPFAKCSVPVYSKSDLTIEPVYSFIDNYLFNLIYFRIF